MPAIPGIIGYTQPGAFSRLSFDVGGVGNPAGIRNVAIIGLGRREEYLVYTAVGNGADGLSVATTAENNYNASSIGLGVSAPNGMNYQVSYYPIVQNQFDLFKNGSALLRSASTVVSDASPVFESGTDYAVDFETGAVLLAPARVSADMNGTDGVFEHLSVPANVPSEVWTLAAVDQPSTRSTVFSVIGSVSGQIFGYETFTEQRNYVYSAGLPKSSGGLFYTDRYGNMKDVPYSSLVLSEDDVYHGAVVYGPFSGATVVPTTVGVAILTDSSATFTAAHIGEYLEFLDNGDPNFGHIYLITDAVVGGDPTKIEITHPDATAITTYNAASYVVVDTNEVGQNFYNRTLTVYGANQLSTTKKKYFVRIMGSAATDLTTTGEEAVYLSPGQALYETSDDYAYDPVTHTWDGTWYRGEDGTGIATNDTGGSGRTSSVPVYTSAGVDSGLLVDFADATAYADFDSLTAYYDTTYNTIPTTTTTMDAANSDPYATYDAAITGDIDGINRTYTITPDAGWGTDSGYVLGTLVVYVNGVEQSLTETRYAEFVGREFVLDTPPATSSTITATFSVGDLTVARLTGFRIGDLWMIESDGKYDNGKITFSLVSGETPFRIGDALTVTVTSSALTTGDNLVASYIADQDVNDPEEFFDPSSLYKKHGYPSTSNTLALASQLAFNNGARSVVALQAKPTTPTTTREVMLASRASQEFKNNGGLYYTGHTHPTETLAFDEADDYENRPHILSHSANNANALTTLHYHDDTNYLNPDKTSTTYYVRVAGTPYEENMHFFLYTASSTTSRQIFLNRVPRSNVTDVVSIPCTRNFGYGCNKSGRNNPFNGNATTTDDVNNPYFLDSTSLYYLAIFADTVTWVGDTPSESAVLTYADEIRNLYSNDHNFPYAADITRYTAYDDYDAGVVPMPCGASFRLRNGLDINGTSTTTVTEVAGLPLSSYTDTELAFKATCTDTYDSVTGLFLKQAYNGGTDDPNNLDIEDAKLYMRTQRTDMSYMLWTGGEIILSDNAGLKDGEGLTVSYISEDDAAFVDPEWSEAARALESVDAYWVCPVPDEHISGVQQTFKNHVDIMSDTPNRRERQLMTGAFYKVNESGTEISLAPENLYAGSSNPIAIEDIGALEGVQGDDLAEITAGSIEDIANYGVPENFGNSFRCSYMYPDKIIVSIAGVNTSVTGLYLAAAAAGYMSSRQNLAEPMTWKNLIGFTITRDRGLLANNRTIADRLGAAGVTVVQQLAAGGKVLHARSTTIDSNPAKQEPTVTDIADLVAQEARSALSSSYIGKPITAELPHAMLATTKSVLQSFIHRKMLNNFDAIKIEQNSTEPRQFDVSFRIQAVVPLLWIYISVEVTV